MPAADYPTLTAALSERGRARFAKAVSDLEAGAAAGSIPNPVFTEAKSLVGRAIEEGWRRAVQDPYTWSRDYAAAETERAALQALNGYPQAHTMATFQRRAEAVPDTPAGRAIRAFLAEIAPLAGLVTRCKDLAVKRQPKVPEATPTERYSAPAASGTAMARVLGVLEEITRASRDALRDLIAERHTRRLDAYLAAQEENRTAPQGKRLRDYSPYEHTRRIGNGRSDPVLRGALEALTESRFDHDSRQTLHQRRPDFRERIGRRADADADELCRSYIDKNLAKLDSIIERKGDFEAIEVIGRRLDPAGMEGRLRVSFADGASFEARSSVVMSWSVHGKAFLRFPLTFHDVVLAGGAPMPAPSEERMNEVFAAPASAPEEDGPEP
ncbi:hypothetical protein [Defluviimonas salinarum]|uniref:Uncharacterized protein n=1 Tax=Defluviimonas salinarum TaxID=2992147 RepID=A0ABT3J5R8_9RHOB|nr:hypothetical protein [Defluviimonas salinarum]MCW3783000.1 hypothetical protein [Defluviimonas salinarum]